MEKGGREKEKGFCVKCVQSITIIRLGLIVLYCVPVVLDDDAEKANVKRNNC